MSLVPKEFVRAGSRICAAAFDSTEVHTCHSTLSSLTHTFVTLPEVKSSLFA
jgi:hypothetical protein